MKNAFAVAVAAVFACFIHEASSRPVRDDTYVASVEEAWHNGQAHFAAGRFREAFDDYFWAAIRDHPEAQERVGIMYLLGQEMFGPAVRRDRDEAVFWLKQAAYRGRDVDRDLTCIITRRVSEKKWDSGPRRVNDCLARPRPDRAASAR
jgi:hypothetical protein